VIGRLPRQTVATVELCDTCTADDCYRGTSKCPKYAGKPHGRPRTHSGLQPSEFADKTDYMRQYNQAYHHRFGRMKVQVKMPRHEFETLQSFFAGKGEVFEVELEKLLRDMATTARIQVERETMTCSTPAE
jgi:hypothetical protein